MEKGILSGRIITLAAISILVFILWPGAARATGTPAVPPDEGGYLYRQLPDALITLHDGRQVPLSRLWNETPLLITFAYSQCSGSCSPFLHTLASGVNKVGGLGKDYRVLVLSFDASDGPGEMAAEAAMLGVERNPYWLFGTAAPADILRLTQAVGFWYRREGASRQFDHPSMLAAVDGGRVVRLLVGATVEPARLKEVTTELRGEFVPAIPAPGKALFRCFSYDPDAGRYRVEWGVLLLLMPGAAATAGVVGIFSLRGHKRI